MPDATLASRTPSARPFAARAAAPAGADAALEAVAAIAVLAGRDDDEATLARGALDALTDLLPFDGGTLSTWNPASGRHEHLAHLGPAVPTGRDTDPFVADPGYRYVRAARVPLRRCDVPGAAGNPLVRDAEAAGFGEGVTACLFDGDRYTGVLNLGIADDTPATASALHRLSLVLEPLARLVDALRDVRAAAAALQPGAPAVLLRSGGAPLPVPGRPRSTLLEPGSPVLAAARRRAPRSRGALSFLWAHEDALWQVLAARLACGGVLVTVREATTPLTRRELEVLTAIAEGLANPAIAARLGISPHTVARHVEHVLDKLGVRGRVEAAACAVREGLLLA